MFHLSLKISEYNSENKAALAVEFKNFPIQIFVWKMYRILYWMFFGARAFLGSTSFLDNGKVS